MAEYLKFVVKGQKLELKGGSTIYSDTVSYIGATFLFDDSWDGLTKVLHLQKDGESDVYDITIEEDVIEPSVSGMNLESGIWQFWVHGTEISGETVTRRLTTGRVSAEVKQSGVLDGGAMPTIEIPLAEQILAKAAYAEANAITSAAGTVDGNVGTPAVTIGFSDQTETGKKINFTFVNMKGETGATGPQGPTGPQGATGPQGEAGQGVAAGGTQGQLLSKKSATDYDTEWVDPPQGGGSRFLSIWNCQTGLPETDPTTSPYAYKTGDYYRVGTVAGYTHSVSATGTTYGGDEFSVQFSFSNNVSTPYSTVAALSAAMYNAGHEGHSGTCSATGTCGSQTVYYVASDQGHDFLMQDSETSLIGAVTNEGAGTMTITDTVTGSLTNYKPSGSSYTARVASTVVETGDVKVGWVYYYDGTQWLAQTSGGGTWGSITGTLSNQTDLQTALDAKQPGDFKVTITGSGSSYASDKTNAEIFAAYQAGKTIYAYYSGILVPAMLITNYTATFGTVIPTEQTLGYNAYTVIVIDDDAVGLEQYGIQDRLVSGTNIKTINNNSILGSGNLALSGFLANWDCTTGLPATTVATGHEYQAGEYYRVSAAAPMTITWDGDATGLTTVDVSSAGVTITSFTRVGDYLTKAKVIGGKCWVAGISDSSITAARIEDLNEYCYLICDTILVTSQACTVELSGIEFSFPSAGLWFCKGTYEGSTIYTKYLTTAAGTNYRPTGSTYSGAASTSAETDTVKVGSIYYYDGYKWLQQHAADEEKQRKSFKVTFTSISENWVADKTNAEIWEAYSKGAYVYAEIAESAFYQQLTPATIGPLYVNFTTQWYGNLVQLTISDDTVSVSSITPQEAFKVTISGSGSSLASDKTNAEIYAAYQDGKYVYAVYTNRVTLNLTLTTVSSTMALFVSDSSSDGAAYEFAINIINDSVTGEEFSFQSLITNSNKLAASKVSGLATVATSGSYNDLSNTPEASVAYTATEVQTIWDGVT